jgi:hypothetical protein
MSKAYASAAARGLPASTPAITQKDLAAYPERYAMIASGASLWPKIKEGAVLAFSKSEAYAPGDFVAIYRRPELMAPGLWPVIIKRLVLAPPPYVRFPWEEHPDSTVHAYVVVEMFNPRQQLLIPCNEILAIHKCLGPVPKGETVRGAAIVRRQREARHG